MRRARPTQKTASGMRKWLSVRTARIWDAAGIGTSAHHRDSGFRMSIVGRWRGAGLADSGTLRGGDAGNVLQIEGELDLRESGRVEQRTDGVGLAIADFE